MGAPAVIKKVFQKPKPPAPPKPVAQAPAPTTAEVSQATTADAYDTRRTKRRGRSATIITGPTGVEQDFTLGKKSLLGG